MKWHNPKWPKTGVSSEKWPYLGNFFGGGPNGKVVAPGILVICPVGKDCNYHTKNWLLAPNVQILGSKLHIFVPSSQFEPQGQGQGLQHEKGVSLVPCYEIPKVLLHPPKKWIFGPKTAKFVPKLAFLAKHGHFWPIWPNVRPKNNLNKLPRWFFSYVGTKTFTYSHKN